MTVKEARKLIAVLMVAYPNYKPVDAELAAATWADAMEEYAYGQVNVALRAYIKSDTSGFAPAPGQLIGKIQLIMQPQELNEMEAWSLVSNALRNGYYGAEEEFAKLPSAVQKAVGSAANLRNWSQTDIESVENVIQSNFMRTYRGVLAREKEYQKLPEDVRLAMNNGLRIEQNSAILK